MNYVRLAIVALFVPVVIVSAAEKAAPEMALSITSSFVTMTADSRELCRYRYGEVNYKPYVDRLLSPGGVNILRDSPHDHVHHHALMYAVTVDGVNFWEEVATSGAERHLLFTGAEIAPSETSGTVRLSEALTWVDPRTKAEFLTETRTLESFASAGMQATVLAWQSQLAAPAGKPSVTLTGGHYHGLGMRFLVSMDTGGEFFNAAGDLGSVFRGTERLGAAAWCAYTALADGKPVTVAMFGHADNPRGPTLWFTMTSPFAYLSATLNLHKEPLVVTAGAPLTLRYATAVWDGRVKPETVEACYRRWAGVK